ncbi:zinc finger CCHC domain-containing protein 7-like [Pelmatolapia mariae]|uniref:zinc finger CCHC domain-containing protein 7-like n=1 Tax=Pelmatolapia mariae TaxID=158779 RepID=UPI002FE643E8
MEHTEENEADDGQEGSEDVFIQGSSSSEDEGGSMRHSMSWKQAARQSRESSPPLLLVFPFSSGGKRALLDAELELSSSDDLQDDKDEDQPIEEWMILEGEEQVEDSSIQLNLSYRNSSGEDLDDEDLKGNVPKSVKESWAVSVKDKSGADQSLTSRYFSPGCSLMCRACNRTGHLAKSCSFHKKYPICVLCGIQGHIQRKCPSRPCGRCGLPSHGLKPCDLPPVWNQHCLRCGMTGHLSEACPDTWRQYHLTIRVEVPLRPQASHKFHHRKCRIHCYNCSKRGHYGYECTKRRMVTGTFPSLPYVYQYDTMEDILQLRTRLEERVKEPAHVFSDLSEKTGASSEENRSVQGWTKTKKELHTRAGRRKTWQERRKERREVKRLRREAQARREGGLLMKSRCSSDDEAYPRVPFSQPDDRQKQSTAPPQKKRRDETGGKKSRKSREAERWKKRGGLKRGYLYPHADIDIGSVNLLSPKQRVRHRKK